MLAVVKPEAAPGADVREVKIPAFGRTDVLVKVKVASICGTDLHIYNWDRWAQNRIKPPLIPGHEFCGEVAAFGDEVDLLVVGSRSYGPVKRLMLGSTSNHLQRHARCSLLVLPRSAASESDRAQESTFPQPAATPER